MAKNESQGLCDTTMTERFEHELRDCCGTYTGNLGPCQLFERGANGRCCYCDHSRDCHSGVRLDV